MIAPEISASRLSSWTIVVRLAMVAGLYFSLHAIILTVVPETLRANGESANIMGLAVGIYISAGMVLDIPISRFAQHVSLKTSLVSGAIGTAIILPLYHIVADSGAPLWGTLGLVFLLGAASSALQGPVLGGLASAAGSRSQLKAQVMNASVQRTGGFLASVVIGVWLPSDDLLTIALVGSAVSSLAALISFRVAQKPRKSAASSSTVRRSLFLNRDIGSALTGNIIIQTLIIVGYSFFPTYLEYSNDSSSVGWLLGIREGGAVLAALLVLFLTGRQVRQLRLLFMCVLLLTTLGLATLPILPFAMILVTFISQGAVIGIGIVLFNLHIFIGSEEWNRITLYGLTSAVGRLSGVLLPLLAGFVISNWISLFPAFIGIFIGTLGAIYALMATRGKEPI